MRNENDIESMEMNGRYAVSLSKSKRGMTLLFFLLRRHTKKEKRRTL